MICRRLCLSFLIAFAGVVISGCNSNNADQDDFIKESLRVPVGYTHTNAQGTVAKDGKDPDDWRISPMYQGLVYIQHPAFPNPVQTENVQLELLVTGIQAVNGMYLFKRSANGTFVLLASQTQSTGVFVFRFDPVRLSENGTYAGAKGLHRVFVYDGSNNLVTYGDIKVN